MSQAKPTDAQIDAYASHYVIHGVQAEAWRVAFPDNKAKPETQHVKASEFHSLDKVQRRVEELRQIARRQSERDFGIDSRRVKQMLTWIANRGIADAAGSMDDAGRLPHDMAASIRALTEINKMDGNHAATKVALGGDPDAPPMEMDVRVTRKIIRPGDIEPE